MAINPPNPNLSILAFLTLTFCYFFIKLFSTNNSLTIACFVIYIITLILVEIKINLDITKSICGSSQWGTAFTVTAIPWIVIFGFLNILLSIFPGWLLPFSNTIGYGITKLFGLGRVLNEIFKNPNQVKGQGNEVLSKLLAKIDTDHSLLINEVTVENFDTFINKSKGLFKNITEENINKLKFFVKLKTIIAEFIWFFLTGSLTIFASSNYIIQSSCNNSVKEMEQTHKEYKNNIDIIENAGIKPRVYTTYE